jgi:aerobic-type carbon monoxide dehydrogenase small subunit (CoxS/CutS family)
VTIQFELDGRQVDVVDDGRSLLDVLREDLGDRTAKDGCSPQGQCGCCTVLVDGAPRVSCVTPARRVAGRRVTTLAGFAEERRRRWADAFCATGASQCGFCTPGIIVRLEGLVAKEAEATSGAPVREGAVERALQAHLCRCTGWQTIVEAYDLVATGAVLEDATDDPSADASALPSVPGPSGSSGAGSPRVRRDRARADERASLEGGVTQRVAPSVALGDAGFADDRAPAGALVAVPDGAGGWSVGENLAAARAAAGKVQGRRTTVDAEPPLPLPDGEWARTLQTSWVEPAYLETDASWCEPGGEPASPLANGGAFGAKATSVVMAAARSLADEYGRPVRVLLAREDAVRLGPKRPPIAAGIRADGTGVVHVVRTPGVAAAVAAVAPGLDVVEVDVPGPSTSVGIRAAGWAEAAVLLASLTDGPDTVSSPSGASCTATVADDATVSIRVRCGDPLDEVVLRSYCIGAAHMALGWVTSEGLAVDADGAVHDLTIRSFGILRALDMPPIEVVVEPSDGPAVNGSDAVFAAVAAAAWRAQGHPPAWPTGRPIRAT